MNFEESNFTEEDVEAWWEDNHALFDAIRRKPPQNVANLCFKDHPKVYKDKTSQNEYVRYTPCRNYRLGSYFENLSDTRWEQLLTPFSWN